MVVFSTSVQIFKQNGELLQLIPPFRLNPANAAQKFQYIKASINPNENEIVLLATNTKDAKNAKPQSKVFVLREKDTEE